MTLLATRPPPAPAAARPPPRVPPWLATAAAYAWRLLVVAAAAAVVLWLLNRLRPVLVALVVSVFVTSVLAPAARRLRALGLRPGLAAAAALLAFVAGVLAVVTLVGAAVADRAGDLGGTVGAAVDDIERWLVEDSPFPLTAEDVDRFGTEAADAAKAAFLSSGGGVVDRAMLAVELVFAVLLGLVLSFFWLADGARFAARARRLLPERHRALASRLGVAASAAVGAFLRGAALLGLVEGAVVAVTLTAVGAELALPVAVLTFLAAFVPFAGAVVAGVVAVLVALAEAGTGAAVVVAVVMLVVQQVDNEVLAPLVYGHELHLHPVVVLLAVASGGALFGIAGTFLSVPLTAVASGVWRAARAKVPEQRAR